jgi:hypothetical protein
MTKSQLEQVLKRYLDVIMEEANVTPERLPDHHFDDRGNEIPWIVAAKHIAWMCNRALLMTQNEDDIEKVMRWLGFIQGYLWCQGMKSINEMRDDNR